MTARGLARLDELEGVSRAHYERLPIAVDLAEGGCARVDGVVAYYAHRDYAAEMWLRSRGILARSWLLAALLLLSLDWIPHGSERMERDGEKAIRERRRLRAIWSKIF